MFATSHHFLWPPSSWGRLCDWKVWASVFWSSHGQPHHQLPIEKATSAGNDPLDLVIFPADPPNHWPAEPSYSNLGNSPSWSSQTVQAFNFPVEPPWKPTWKVLWKVGFWYTKRVFANMIMWPPAGYYVLAMWIGSYQWRRCCTCLVLSPNATTKKQQNVTSKVGLWLGLASLQGCWCYHPGPRLLLDVLVFDTGQITGITCR